MSEADHRTLDWAVEIIGMCEPIRCHQGGMWFGHNHNFADATFVDYGAADAFAVAAKALPVLVRALKDVTDANREFRATMPDDWEGDPLQDACDEADRLLGVVGQPSARDSASQGGDK